MQYSILIILLLFMIIFMVVQGRKAKQQQQERQNFINELEPGTEIITIGGVIGKVVSSDPEYDEVVIDSEGSLLRFTTKAISRQYVRPAYVRDDEVDENGNPLPQNEESEEAEPAEAAAEQQPAEIEQKSEPTEVIETSTEGLPYGAREIEVEQNTETAEDSAEKPATSNN
ncbi:preprotein translocase subunit YajC [Bifidobacterium dolichotidis]|uniref:Preprotein translocase subunit YajC n=1 Tax=Bifidobacterium dolichotidis TaxID=2306976 RepID=A0A430FT13_9BIFI|nr:preprotein translocase subunit YajC [Bifidobacterium dolichotidis]